ncbi:MAG: YraN family protein [Hydrotalea flava]|uniref:YraN family protein n=1 Tax=Hydrotalea TaxID=1004300 RepID=UPI000832A668|nr:MULTISPECIES: YraN family protein [Hydrotalea]RTL55056.1 MAG: YraN family protein [Sphingobacteriales bacterium]NIM36111.1 YraN family protein [Hydrotalea flava]NIM38958.1 YraN family protein [Hydrotalea flava]NIN04147.1 YraN family protein [Hydrotalea flava]NIN15820.1 YraN family protein [Hydrotalea flava]
MSHQKEIGNLGENLAIRYILENGFQLLYQNWRYKYWEVDIIALKNNTIHFIEVKTRQQSPFGFPEDSIQQPKMDALKKAASAFMEQHPQWEQLQFDVIAITLQQQQVIEIYWIEDVFF